MTASRSPDQQPMTGHRRLFRSSDNNRVGGRRRRDARDGFTEKKRKQVYDLISHYATHATPAGFGLVVKDNFGEIGPFYRPEMFSAWMQEAVKMICNCGIVFGYNFKDVDPKLLATKMKYVTELKVWRTKYFGGK